MRSSDYLNKQLAARDIEGERSSDDKIHAHVMIRLSFASKARRYLSDRSTQLTPGTRCSNPSA